MEVTKRGLKQLISSAIQADVSAKPFECIPGPKSLPILGGLWKYLPLIGNYDLNRLHITGYKMQEEYGSLVKQNMGGEVIVNVFDPSDIEQVYKSEGKFPARRSHLAVAHYRLSRPHLYNTGGLLPTNGSEWWRLRSTFQKPLARIQDVRLFLPSSDKIIGDFLTTFIGEGVVIYDFLPHISRLNLELTWSALFGERLGSFHSTQSNCDSIVAGLIEATEIANSCILRTDMTETIWSKMKTPIYKKLEKSLSFIECVVDKQLNKITTVTDESAQKKTEETISLVDKYLKFEESDLKDVRGMVSDLILGGIDTTSYTSCFILYHISRNKFVQERLKAEALKLLPNANSPVSPSVLNEAIYSRAILKETFRLNPIATGISRNLDQDTTLSGYLVPKGTLIITHNLVACRLEKNFKDPLTFLPERWIRGSKDYCNVSPYLVLPFSHGIRTCIARRLAEQNLLSFILKVGRNYSLEWKGSQLDVVTPIICKPDNHVAIAFKSI
ncbi:cytochrome P450 302a1, mitochondrial [Rhodnius prolixus]|uniref:cytochrome P450 302a1, mitochondrial n=1 Tax=Rhodnius prolixus TaxID=13249 RepID=UPI003D187C0C